MVTVLYLVYYHLSRAEHFAFILYSANLHSLQPDGKPYRSDHQEYTHNRCHTMSFTVFITFTNNSIFSTPFIPFLSFALSYTQIPSALFFYYSSNLYLMQFRFETNLLLIRIKTLNFCIFSICMRPAVSCISIDKNDQDTLYV